MLPHFLCLLLQVGCWEIVIFIPELAFHHSHNDITFTISSSLFPWGDDGTLRHPPPPQKKSPGPSPVDHLLGMGMMVPMLSFEPRGLSSDLHEVENPFESCATAGHIGLQVCWQWCMPTCVRRHLNAWPYFLGQAPLPTGRSTQSFGVFILYNQPILSVPLHAVRVIKMAN